MNWVYPGGVRAKILLFKVVHVNYMEEVLDITRSKTIWKTREVQKKTGRVL